MVVLKKNILIMKGHFYNYVGPKVGTVGSTSGGPKLPLKMTFDFKASNRFGSQ